MMEFFDDFFCFDHGIIRLGTPPNDLDGWMMDDNVSFLWQLVWMFFFFLVIMGYSLTCLVL